MRCHLMKECKCSITHDKKEVKEIWNCWALSKQCKKCDENVSTNFFIESNLPQADYAYNTKTI